MNVRPLAAAVEDAATISANLERFRAGWSDAFETAMRQAVAAIGANPQMYPRTEDGPDEPETREFFIARFEHRVVYAIWKGEAVIVAVIHARTRPRSWHGRLTDLD
ncbi:type II toxin-antitoxin system RelE/ParE family toxin [Gemmata sp.]|uniref:type II toxin-antitoxin system RelE/ParE family toxin n=1 Tax=Gemmata sp. TaxID=1914242 RepID=UPI003F72D181